MTGPIQRRDLVRTGFAAVGALMLTPSNRRLWNLQQMNNRIWFANQDNGLLPSVETCLQEAVWVAKNIPA